MFFFPKHGGSAVVLLTAISSTLIVGCNQGEASNPLNTSPAAAKSAASLSAEDERRNTLKQLEAKAAQGDPDAQLAFAKLLLDGIDATPNYARAKTLLEQAAEKGVAEAHLGLFRLKDYKLLPDDGLISTEMLREKALATKDPFVTTFLSGAPTAEPSEVVRELASNGYPLAMSKVLQHLGFCIQHMDFNKKYKSETYDWCRSVEKDKSAFKNAVALGNALLNINEVDAAKLRYWVDFRRRVFHAQFPALIPLETLKINNVFMRNDPYTDQIASALGSMGRVLGERSGEQTDPTQAAIFFKRAAELGDDQAQNEMGELHLDGKGVLKDYELAARYFGQAAQQANGTATKNLGLAYAIGRGVPKDLPKAYFWLSIAAMGRDSGIFWNFGPDSQDFGKPSALRDKISRGMTSDEIAQAHRLAREWRPSPQYGEPPKVDSASLSAAGISATPGAKQPLKKTATGTAFWVSKDGFGITNHHVVDGCAEVRVKGREGLISVITADQINDLALLQITGGLSATALIAETPAKLRQGDDIVAYGFPLNSLLSSSGNLTPGVVSATSGLGNNSNQIQITAPIQPGSSGSPVMNKRAEIVAVVSMKLSDSKMAKATGSVAQNVNFAVSGQTLRAFLDANSVNYRTGGMFTFDKNTADIAEEAKKWTSVVECWR